MERYIHPYLSMAEEGFVNGFFEAIPLTITIGENGLKKDVGPGAPLTYFNDGGVRRIFSLPMCGFAAQLVEQRSGNAEVTGSNPVEALSFSRLFFAIA